MCYMFITCNNSVNKHIQINFKTLMYTDNVIITVYNKTSKLI